MEQRCKIRQPLPPPSKLRPFPTTSAGGDDSAGTLTNEMSTDVPTTEQLGLGPAPVRDPRSVLSFEGGETAGLRRVRQYIWEEDRLREYKETRNGLLGSGFSSKFSPWLALGCLSPKTIVSEVRVVCWRYGLFFLFSDVLSFSSIIVFSPLLLSGCVLLYSVSTDGVTAVTAKTYVRGHKTEKLSTSIVALTPPPPP